MAAASLVDNRHAAPPDEKSSTIRDVLLACTMRGRWIRKEATMSKRIRTIPDERAGWLAYRDPDDEDYEDEEDEEEDDDGYREPTPDEEAARRAGRIAAACRVVTKR
jgi:hypothetical protein